ncbi:hypothetical protein Dda_4278 [Drechslerella dactyloides]|uniref:Uncharacterized protein n=1 Tax=Drechslerella dactyloides TaxID=74499 RepID=A0AAD6NLW5_DREDA|nr:hypothetical protein Dda_4278 [Drechslerella dactyloides]
MTQMAARPRRGDNTCRLNGSRDDVLYELHQYLHVPSGHPNERSRGENGFGYGLLASLWNTAESKYFSEMIVHGLQDGHFVYLSLSVGLIYSLCTGVTRTVSLSELLLESFGLFDGHALGKLFYQRRWDLIRLLQATDSNLPTIVRSFDSTAIRDIKKLLHFLAFKLAASGPTSNGERFYFIYPGANQLENALSFPLVTDSPLSMFRNTSRSAVFAIVSTRCFARTRFKCRNPVAAVDLSIEMEEDGPDAITGSAAGRQISLEHYFKGIEIGFARQYAPINQVNACFCDAELIQPKATATDIALSDYQAALDKIPRVIKMRNPQYKWNYGAGELTFSEPGKNAGDAKEPYYVEGPSTDRELFGDRPKALNVGYGLGSLADLVSGASGLMQLSKRESEAEPAPMLLDAGDGTDSKDKPAVLVEDRSVGTVKSLGPRNKPED